MGNALTMSRPKREAARPAHLKMTRRPPFAQSEYTKTPIVYPRRHCYLRYLRTRRINDYLAFEIEFISAKKKVKKSRSSYADERRERRIVDEIRGLPIGLARISELYNNGKNAIVRLDGMSSSWYVPVLSIVDQQLLNIYAPVLVRLNGKRSPKAVVGVLTDPNIDDERLQAFKVEKVPTETFADIGGLEDQIRELKETVELPLTQPELYEDMGIRPPKGVILYGEPGTGKTLLAKAVASSTKATFMRVSASELVRKVSGEGPRLVRNLFKTAKEHSPCILFIDEIDAIGSKRHDTNSSGEKEIQRTMLEMLNQLDGFDTQGDVKVIMATNRIQSLDPALIRPGRIDRKIEIPKPDKDTKLKILQLQSSSMTLATDVDFALLLAKHEDISGADIKAICTEAGLLALREQRRMVGMVDFETGLKNVQMKKKNEKETYFL